MANCSSGTLLLPFWCFPLDDLSSSSDALPYPRFLVKQFQEDELFIFYSLVSSLGSGGGVEINTKLSRATEFSFCLFFLFETKSHTRPKQLRVPTWHNDYFWFFFSQISFSPTICVCVHIIFFTLQSCKHNLVILSY